MTLLNLLFHALPGAAARKLNKFAVVFTFFMNVRLNDLRKILPIVLVLTIMYLGTFMKYDSNSRCTKHDLMFHKRHQALMKKVALYATYAFRLLDDATSSLFLFTGCNRKNMS